MMFLSLFIAGWLSAGLLAVFIAGIGDRFFTSDEKWPSTSLLFLLGYIGLAVVLTYILGFGVLPKIEKRFLDKLYLLGKGEK